MTMGNRIEWPGFPADTSWTNIYVYRAPSLTGTYTLIATLSAKDSDGYWTTEYWDESGGTNHYYKIAPYDSAATPPYTGALSDPIGATSITPVYTTAAKIASFLQVRIGGDTKPAIWEVEEMIARKQDEIDFRTAHAWRTRYSMGISGTETASPDYEYHSLRLENEINAGIPVFLDHRKVMGFDSTKGDVLELYDGQDYTDYLADKTQGRNDDWWLDNANGKLYIRDVVRTSRQWTVRVKYRYGEATVPGDIEELCILMVAVDLIMSNDRTSLVPQSAEGVSLESRLAKYQTRINDIISQRKEIVVAGSD